MHSPVNVSVVVIVCENGLFCACGCLILGSSFTGSSEAHSGNAFAMSSCNASQAGFVMHHRLVTEIVPPDHLLLNSAPNIGPLIP
jgi:hypothetical protein